LYNKERIIYFPPPKEPKAIMLDLKNFRPTPKPKPIPKKEPIKRVIAPPKEIIDTPKPQRKVTKEKKALVIEKSNNENNATLKREIIKAKIKKLKEKKRAKELEAKRALEEKKAKIELDKEIEKMRRRELAKRKKRIRELKKLEAKMIKEQKKRLEQYKKRSSSSLANSLMNSGRAYRPQRRKQLNRNSSSNLINRLYGKEFNTYSSAQKSFLKSNLGRIHSITQRALNRNGYPESAIRMGQEGVNVVSFYLHPNGNITNLKLEKSMGHSSLDENTLQVIRIAYSEYPLPKVKTKIKFYVNYTIN
jgi:TonB family protein